MPYYAFKSTTPGYRRLLRRRGALAAKRCIEISLVIPMLLILAPFWAVKNTMVRKECRTDRTQLKLRGLDGKQITLSSTPEIHSFYEFQKQAYVDQVPLFWRVLCGDMALIGAAPVPAAQPTALYEIVGVQPGIYSTFTLKRQANLTLLDEDYELLSYIPQASLVFDLGIFFRSLIGKTFNQRGLECPNAIEMMGVKIHNLDCEQAINWIQTSAEDKEQVSRLAFVNPDCLNRAFVNPEYKYAVSRFDRVFADGIGVHIGCGMLGVAMKDNLNGTDLFPRICELAQAECLTLYLLGGKPGITDKVVKNLVRQYPSLKIAGHQHGYFSEEDTSRVIGDINQSAADILLVAMGAPRQELWIDNNFNALRVGLALGVGGLFDFVSETMPRAPIWMREIGLEWVYRLYQEPARMWRRYIIGNPVFLYRVWKSKRIKSRESTIHR